MNFFIEFLAQIIFALLLLILIELINVSCCF